MKNFNKKLDIWNQNLIYIKESKTILWKEVHSHKNWLNSSTKESDNFKESP